MYKHLETMKSRQGIIYSSRVPIVSSAWHPTDTRSMWIWPMPLAFGRDSEGTSQHHQPNHSVTPLAAENSHNNRNWML